MSFCEKLIIQNWRIINGLQDTAGYQAKGQAKDGNSIEAQEAAVREAGAEEIYADAFTGDKETQTTTGQVAKSDTRWR